MMKIKTLYIALLSLVLIQIGCTEPFEIETIDYESVLVVESTITNEMKHQIVKLSRTSTLDSVDILYESGAAVDISTSTGNTYYFSEDFESGYYVSDEEFQAIPNVEYTLNILTGDGKKYASSPVLLPPAVEMDKIYAERIVDQQQDGVQVLVDTYDPTGSAKYFRYEYEETYKIVAPYPSPYIAEVVNYNPNNGTYQVLLTPREPEEVCYSSENSTGIIQTATTDLSENRVFRFPVRYLDKDNPVMQSRYSVLVKQYVQSIEAYTFYKIINELGSVGSLLSQGQPGYVAGNMVSEENPDEKVLGFFEASSMTSKRIFFGYEDFGIEKPPYFVDCEVIELNYLLSDDPDERTILYTYLTYYNYQVLNVGQGVLYSIVRPECGLCTSFSSNVKPDFWED